MVAKGQERCVVTQGVVVDKTGNALQTKPSHLTCFGSAIAADEGVSFLSLCGQQYSKDAAPELGHTAALCSDYFGICMFWFWCPQLPLL